MYTNWKPNANVPKDAASYMDLLYLIQRIHVKDIFRPIVVKCSCVQTIYLFSIHLVQLKPLNAKMIQYTLMIISSIDYKVNKVLEYMHTLSQVQSSLDIFTRAFMMFTSICFYNAKRVSMPNASSRSITYPSFILSTRDNFTNSTS